MPLDTLFLLEDGVNFLLEEDGLSYLLEETALINYGNVVAGSSALPAGVNSTYFYGCWAGYIVPTATGLWTLGVNSQDGCNLWLGTELLIANLGNTQNANSSLAYTDSAQVYLTKGVKYPFILSWQHGTGANYQCQLLCTPPVGFGSVQLLPTSMMTDQIDVITGVLNGTWWNGTSAVWYPTGLGTVGSKGSPVINNSGITTSTGAILTQSGTSKTILVSAFTVQYGFGTVNYNSGSVTPATYGTFLVYYSDPQYLGGSITYMVTNAAYTTTSDDSLSSLGVITTAGGGGGTGGGGGGGTGGGGGVCFSPDTIFEDGVIYGDRKPGDLVLTAKGSHCKVHAIITRDYEGLMYDIGCGLVTPGHLLLKDGAWVPAEEWGFPAVEYKGKVMNMMIETDDEPGKPDTEHSYTLANAIVAHNYMIVC